MNSEALRSCTISRVSLVLVLMLSLSFGCRSVECTPGAETALAPPIVVPRLTAVVQPHVGLVALGTTSVSTQLNDSEGCEDLLCRDLAAALVNTGRFTVVPARGAPMAAGLELAHPALPDVIINIEVHEFYAYQPMRLRATFHLIDPMTGQARTSITGAWESSGDFQPIEPSREGNFKLRQPVIPAVEEARALTRTSPRTFLNAVTHEVAKSVVATVDPVRVELTAAAESAPEASRRRR